jgi:hypothetical protein
MADEIITELWEVKDAIAREHGYDVDALINHLKKQRGPADCQTVDLSARKKATQSQVTPTRPEE